MPENKWILQLRVSPDLYEAIAEEARKRKHEKPKPSLNSVANEWLEQHRLERQSK
jgi:hypothetical protein